MIHPGMEGKARGRVVPGGASNVGEDAHQSRLKFVGRPFLFPGDDETFAFHL